MSTQLSMIQDYILQSVLHHRLVEEMGPGGAVWAGVDFTNAVSVMSENERTAVPDLYRALEDWVLVQLARGETVPVIEGIDLGAPDKQTLLKWHDATPRKHDPDQAWFWTEEWQAGEREADNDIVAGRGRDLHPFSVD